MKTVVITGSTRGIGYGMAQAFLARGHRVVVNGRTPESTQKAVLSLQKTYSAQNIVGVSADISQYADNETLWQQAKAHFGTVDMWVNNAGIDIPMRPFWEVPRADLDSICAINLQGMMYGSQVALRGMLEQGSGTLYNMEGFGSNGAMRAGMTSYGTTKVALRYFTRSLQKEVKGKPVIVGTMSPGIVVTDLLTQGIEARPIAEQASTKRIFNILADTVEDVAPFLVDRALSNTRTTPEIAWLTTPKVFWRFLTAPFNRRDLFAPKSS